MNTNALGTFSYELKPFLLLALSVYALSAENPNPVLVSSGLILLFCSGLILKMRMKHRRGAGLEALFYELQPFLYLGLAMYVLFFKRSSIATVGCAMVLIFCTVVILNWRYRFRRENTQNKSKTDDRGPRY
jgi:membrane protein CcdC involved in cytochrome C biogenesis